MNSGGFTREERQLDLLFEGRDMAGVPVPDELEGRIRERINNIRAGRHYIVKSLSALAALIIIFIISLRAFPEFRAYAEGIPVLGEALKWFSGDIGKDELEGIFDNAEAVAVESKDAPGGIKVLDEDEIEILRKSCSDAVKVPSEKGYDVASPDVVPYPYYVINIRLEDGAVKIAWDSIGEGGSYFKVMPLPEDADARSYLVFQKSNGLWNALKSIMPKEPVYEGGELRALTGAVSLRALEGKGTNAGISQVPIGPNKTLHVARILNDAVPTGETMEPSGEYAVTLEFEVGGNVETVYLMENSFIYKNRVYESEMIQMRIIRAVLDPPYD